MQGFPASKALFRIKCQVSGAKAAASARGVYRMYIGCAWQVLTLELGNQVRRDSISPYNIGDCEILSIAYHVRMMHE